MNNKLESSSMMYTAYSMELLLSYDKGSMSVKEQSGIEGIKIWWWNLVQFSTINDDPPKVSLLTLTNTCIDTVTILDYMDAARAVHAVFLSIAKAYNIQITERDLCTATCADELLENCGKPYSTELTLSTLAPIFYEALLNISYDLGQGQQIG